MSVLRIPVILFLLATLSCFSISKLYQIHGENNQLRISQLTILPPAITKAMSMEFSGIVADYLMLNVLTFMGEKVLRKKQTSTEEWQLLLKAFQQIIFLDPRATDPFILATTTLPWEAGIVKETNELLLQAATIRTDDYRPYFFLWYNYYNFLDDPKQAAFYLKKAAKIPGSPSYLAPLVTRMHLHSGQVQGSILYIQELLHEVNDPKMREYLLVRFDALKKIAFLEDQIRKYAKIFYRPPQKLEDLISKGIISTIPKDPYGGTFYMLENKRVYSTSKLVNMKDKK
jgi:hypothetical protein